MGVFFVLVIPARAQSPLQETASAAEFKKCAIDEVSTQQAGTNDASKRFVDKKLTVWQTRLKLEEWRVTPSFTMRQDLKPRTLGGIRWDKTKKTAVIWIFDPAEYRLPFCQMLDDMEMTIVHELIHLKLAGLPRSEASRSSEESAVNGIAEALLDLDRQKP